MLAYVFWHVPGPSASPDAYEALLRAFHDALRAAPPAGLGQTAVAGLPAIPWLGGAGGYEDWYLVADFGALGRLNETAVTDSRRAPHDAAAAAAGAGTAGVMAHVAGPLLPSRPAWAAWLEKPAGVAYGDFHAELEAAVRGRDASAWQRQMVLGPAAEYCVLSAETVPLSWPLAHAWPLRPVVAAV